MSHTVELDIGLVVAGHGRHYIVETPDAVRVTCHPRGKRSDCVVGDRVRWQPSGDEGVIEHVEPRRNLLYRQESARCSMSSRDGPTRPSDPLSGL